MLTDFLCFRNVDLFIECAARFKILMFLLNFDAFRNLDMFIELSAVFEFSIFSPKTYFGVQTLMLMTW